MGQVNCHNSHNSQLLQQFQDLKELPPEVAISVLSNLNATDLCLASCVWKDLAEDDMLWKGLCKSKWTYATVYCRLHQSDCPQSFRKKPVFKNLYLLLDDATLVFTFRPTQGIQYLINHHVLSNTPIEIARFINGTYALNKKSVLLFLAERLDVFREFMKLQDFTGISICDSLRIFFKKVKPPEQRGDFLQLIVDCIANKYIECHQECMITKDQMSVICYSIILLSVDLYSPHVKSKMSKREFIHNNRPVLAGDMMSDIYDDVYLNGHIVSDCQTLRKPKHRFPFYRPYGAIFELKRLDVNLTCSC